MNKEFIIMKGKVPDDYWHCICGNEPDCDGFYACDAAGNFCEPVRGWDNQYRCNRCGRVIEGDTLEVVGLVTA